MQLLVSVRSGTEVGPALAGGADIIDAKEPANGSLGAVSAATLAEVVSLVPAGQALSIALGDVASSAAVRTLISELALPSRSAPTYLKLGFAGVVSQETVGEMIGAAAGSVARFRFPVMIVAVAYADADRAATLPPEIIPRLAADAGAGGILIDTHVKDGTSLLDWRTAERLAAWVSGARASGLMVGVAGSLKADDLPEVGRASPDVIGFRGAACDAGRLGPVSADRVARLRRCLDAVTRNSEGCFAYTAGGWRNA